MQKVAKLYECEFCQYKCANKTNYEKHLSTRKHQMAIVGNKKVAKSCKNYICNCGKEYISSSGLWRHKKKCTYIDASSNEPETSDISYKEMFLEIIEENKELRRQITQLIPHIGNNNITNNTQKFNINVFLNDKCKDALDIDEFIKSIKISIQELDNIKITGMAQGLSSAIMSNLKRLSIYERPIHCTDIKRETLYIKDDNHWGCDHNKVKIKEAIKKMASKSYMPLQEWINKNPDFKEVDEKQNYVANVLSTIGKNTETENIDKKIIKNLCLSTYIKQ